MITGVVVWWSEGKGQRDIKGVVVLLSVCCVLRYVVYGLIV